MWKQNLQRCMDSDTTTCTDVWETKTTPWYTSSEQALVIESERGDNTRIGCMYGTMVGDVLVGQEGREKEAILMFQKLVGLFEEGNASEELIRIFLKLGQA